ncbi:MAG: serine hydrolase [Thermoguttaceae bacterium]|jgi:CubicO group peptidase (beta-lactamase class C family)
MKTSSNRIDLAEACTRFEKLAHRELQRGMLTGVSVAWVDDQRIVYLKGFGLADPQRNVAARPDTVYRAGSISKLFTAVAAMQLAEQGKLDIDRPVTDYAPQFRIVVPFEDAGPITPRLLMGHRAGMIRESPVGGYFDPNEPTLDATVASTADCVLVHRPGTVTKYSNIGASVNGWLVEKITGTPFPEYQRRHVFEPLGMVHSSFVRNDDVHRRLANGQMRIADGRGGFFAADAPLFELATVPAGNLYTTAEDLARFAMMLCGGGRAGGRQLLRPETLEQMFQSQAPQDRLSYGLGFVTGKFREHDTVGHMGAVYGFTSSLLVVPKHKLGVVVLANDDVIAGTVTKLAEAALELLLQIKTGEPPREEEKTVRLPIDQLAAYAGDYESESYWARIEIRGQRLWANVSGQEFEVTPAGGDRFWGDGRNAARVAWNFERDAVGAVQGFTALFQHFARVDPAAAAEIPAAWNDFLGCYGPKFIPLVISVKHGHLYAMTENMFDYRLTPLNRTSFHLPTGMYLGEQLVFNRGADGRVYAATLANMVLKRIDED